MTNAAFDALRALVRDRGVTALAVVLLASTLGATAGMFAVVDAVLLRPLPFADQGRTVVIWQRELASESPVVEVALGEADQWRVDGHQVLDDLAVFGSVNWTLSIGDEHEPRQRVPYAGVSARFFAVADVAPALGRVLLAQDDAGQVPHAAVISDQFWRDRFEGDAAAIGTTIRAQDLGLSPADTPPDLIEIVGIMPPAFDFPRGARLWLPVAPLLRSAARGSSDPADEAWNLSRLRVFYALGRLRPGVTSAAATQVLTDLVRRGDDAGGSADAVVTPVVDYLTGTAKPVLWLMQAGAALMLVLACSSVAGLMVFRAARQDYALAVRLALGATRAHLLARTVLESGLLAVAGGLAGLAVTHAVVRVLVASAPLDVPRLDTVAVATSTYVGLAIMVLLVAVLVGVWPAWFVTRVKPGPTLTTGARTAMHPRERRWQRLVVGWQVALAVLVLTGAALFLRSVSALDRTALGFAPRGLTAVEIEPSNQDLESGDRFYAALVARVQQTPGVRHAAAAYLKPLSGPVGMDGRPVLFGQEGLGPEAAWRANPRANIEAVTPGYFTTLGTRLLAGRDFGPTDRAGVAGAIIVSASAAARYWPGRDAIGQQLVVPTQRDPGPPVQLRWMTVVGVVEDVRYRGVTDPRLDVYLPAAQSTERVKHLMIRTEGDAQPSLAAIRTIAREIDPGAHVGEVVTMSDAVARETAPWRFAMRVLIGYGMLAVVLATAGLTGKVSLAVTLRRRELGIRAALGATPERLRWHVLREAVGVMAIAIAAGTLLSLAMGRARRRATCGHLPRRSGRLGWRGRGHDGDGASRNALAGRAGRPQRPCGVASRVAAATAARRLHAALIRPSRPEPSPVDHGPHESRR